MSVVFGRLVVVQSSDSAQVVIMSGNPRQRILGLSRLRDEDLLARLAKAEKRGRRLDAERVFLAAEIAERSRPELGQDGLARRLNHRKAEDLIEQVTLVSRRTAAKRVKLGAAVRARSSVRGDALEPVFPAVAASLMDGAVGVDTAETIVTTLSGASGGPGMPGILEAEAGLVAAATGTMEGVSAAPFSADQIHLQATLWLAHIDPDGAEPDYELAVQHRRFTRGIRRGQLVHYVLDLPTDRAAIVDDFLSAHLNPHTHLPPRGRPAAISRPAAPGPADERPETRRPPRRPARRRRQRQDRPPSRR
jgi:hypothetical protein